MERLQTLAGTWRADGIVNSQALSPPVIVVMGPTASGKTALAMQLIDRLPCDIISVDSAMVYRGMDIGTSKPSAEVLMRYPHRLVDICEPNERYSAARFRLDALREIADAKARGRIPMLVGGTMLYFKALLQGLAELPGADPVVRAQLLEEASQKGWAEMHARLARVDAASARRIHPNDPQRIQRALEVFQVSGIPLSEWLTQGQADSFPYRVCKIAVAPMDRDELRHRIDDRFKQMLSLGFVEEVKRLWSRGDLTPDMPSMRAVGYRQIWGYLEGQYDYEAMVSKAVTATHQLSKRQMTWLRAERDLNWYAHPEADEVASKLRQLLGI